VAAVEMRRRRDDGVAPRLRDADLLDVGEQRHAQVRLVGHEPGAADNRLRWRVAAVGWRRVLVIRERAAVAQRAHVVGEALAGRVEVQVADIRVAPVPEPVDDKRGHPRERSRRHEDRLALGAEPDGQLALQDVEEVGVVAVDVQVGALTVRSESRPRRVQRVVVREDLDASVGRVADDFARPGRYEGRFGYVERHRRSA
jgi:hypothetical protein